MTLVHTLQPEPLTAAVFAPYGQVIEAVVTPERINAGTTDKFADLANLDLDAAGGRAQVSLYHGQPYELPFAVAMLERHPLSSQLFMPLSATPFLVIVAPPGPGPEPQHVRAFVSNGEQGVNYDRGTWHHPLIALGEASWFMVLERRAQDENCDEHAFTPEGVLSCAAPAAS